MVSRVAVTTGAPGSAAAFSPTLPTHASGDRLLLFVAGKYDTTTVPTINQGWTLAKNGTGGTGGIGNDIGITFWAVYAKDATSSSETAPTVTPGATAPNSWEWIATTYRPGTGKSWADAIGTSATWVQSASDTMTGSPVSGTCGAFTNQPTAGDAIAGFGVIPTDTGTAIASGTLTATGLSGGTVTADTYIENTLGADTTAMHCSWTGFTGTASAGAAVGLTATSATNHSGSVVAVALRETAAPVSGTINDNFGFSAPVAGVKIVQGTTASNFGFDAPVAGTKTVQGTITSNLGFDAPVAGTVSAGSTEVTGTINDNFGFSAPVAGTKVVQGTVSDSLGFSAPVVGVPVKVGTVNQSLGFDAPVAGVPVVVGTVASNLGFTAPVAGTVVGTVNGTIADSFGFSAPVAGTAVVVGTVASNLGFAGPVAGTVLTGSLVTGLVSDSFGFAAPVVGTAISSSVGTGPAWYFPRAGTITSRVGEGDGSHQVSAGRTTAALR